MKAYWKKPFYSVKERDRGSVVNAIIVYEKRAVFFDAIDRGPHPDGQIQVIAVGWSHYLRIDLWIVVFDFQWRSGSFRDNRYTLKKL